MKNLENYGVQELNVQELKETDGGFWGIVIAVYLVLALYAHENHH